MAMDDQEMMAEEPGEDESGESSNRTFMMLALGLGGLFIVGVICIAAIFFYQQSQRNLGIARNNAQATKNAMAIAAMTSQAMTPTPPPTEVPPTVAPTTAPTIAPTNTPAPVAPAGATPTETPMVTVTAAKPAATATATKSASGATSSGSTTTGGAAAITPTAAMSAEKTPDTGVGGFGMVLAAAVLLVVLFAARRLRLSPR